jgi:hypothetical protein
MKFRRCEGLVTKSPIIKRSVKINGRKTSVCLEDANMMMSGSPTTRDSRLAKGRHSPGGGGHARAVNSLP